MKLKVEYVKTEDLKPYANNAKIHTAEQVDQIKKSIELFGMNDPIAVWKDNEIIEGHGRLLACLELGMEEVPVIRLDGLTDEARRSYMLVHNQLTMNTGFEEGILELELERLPEIEWSAFGFDMASLTEGEAGDAEGESASRLEVVVECDTEDGVAEVLGIMKAYGYKCRRQ